METLISILDCRQNQILAYATGCDKARVYLLVYISKTSWWVHSLWRLKDKGQTHLHQF